MAQTTYLITGINRGIGLGMTKALLSRPNTTVIGSVRDVNSSSTKALYSLPTAAGSKIIVVKIDAKVDTDPAAAVKTLESEHGISVIDIVIANAAISNYYGKAIDTPISEVNEHFQVNFVGPFTLFQAVYPLLKKSANPKFVPISTGAASIGDYLPIDIAAYGSSKVALNFLTVRINGENPWLTAFPLNPGWVQTEMGNRGAATAGMAQAPMTLEQSISGILREVDNATKESAGGKFMSADDTHYAW